MGQQTLFLVVGFTLATCVFQTVGQHPGLFPDELFNRDITQELLNNEASLLVPITSSVSASLRLERRQFINVTTLPRNCLDNAVIIIDNVVNRPSKPDKYQQVQCGNSEQTLSYTSFGPVVMLGLVPTALSNGSRALSDGFTVTVTLNDCSCGKLVLEDMESIHDRCHEKSLMQMSQDNVPLGKCCLFQFKTREKLFYTTIDFTKFNFPSDEPCSEDNSVGISRKGDFNRMNYYCGSTGKPVFWKDKDTNKENLVRLSRNLLVKVCRKTSDVEFLATFYTAGKRGVSAADAVAAKDDGSCICGRLPAKSRRRRSAGCSTENQCKKKVCENERSCIKFLCKKRKDCVKDLCVKTKLCKEKHRQSHKICKVGKDCAKKRCSETKFCKNYCKKNCKEPECKHVDCRGKLHVKCNKKKHCKKENCIHTQFCKKICENGGCQAKTTQNPCKTGKDCAKKRCKKSDFCKKYCEEDCQKPRCKNVIGCRGKPAKVKCNKLKHCRKEKCKNAPLCNKPQAQKHCKDGKCKTTSKQCHPGKDCVKRKCRDSDVCTKYCGKDCKKPGCKFVANCRGKPNAKCFKLKHCKHDRCRKTPFCTGKTQKVCKGPNCKPCRIPQDCGEKRCRHIRRCLRRKPNAKCFKLKHCKHDRCKKTPFCTGKTQKVCKGPNCKPCSRKKDCKKKRCQKHPNCLKPKTTVEVPDIRQGTTPLNFKEWPWIVLIQIEGKPVCQGVLIGTSEVLTCDKCATSDTASEYTVIIKDIKFGIKDSEEQTRKVKKIVKTSGNSCSGDMCLAMLILDSEITFDKKRVITPLCLACINKKLTMLDETAFLVGYGFDPAITTSSIHLKDTKGKIVDNAQCTSVPDGAFCYKMADKLPGHSCGTVATDFGAPLIVRLGARGVYVHYSLRGILCGYDCESRTGTFIEAFSTGVLGWIFQNMESKYCHTPVRAGKKKPPAN